MTWEYEVVKLVSSVEPNDLKKTLNERGNQNWELICIVGSPATAVFKRQHNHLMT